MRALCGGVTVIGTPLNRPVSAKKISASPQQAPIGFFGEAISSLFKITETIYCLAMLNSGSILL
jgi:hypothetical protein